MKRKIEFVVTRNGEKYSKEYGGDSSSGSWVDNAGTRLEEMGAEAPQGLQKVIYTLAPKHGYFSARVGCSYSYLFMRKFVGKNDYSPSIINCMIPWEWGDLRFNRKVEKLDAR